MANEKEVDPELVKRADYAYNPHPADVQAPALDAGLVERMYAAFAITPSNIGTECMTAALRVAADALLGLVSKYLDTECGYSPSGRDHACNWIRARLLAPAKSVGERVRIEVVHTGLGRQENRLFCDGCEIKPADVLEYARLGLIATLKQEGK